jgi:hypothetical protein
VESDVGLIGLADALNIDPEFDRRAPSFVVGRASPEFPLRREQIGGTRVLLRVQGPPPETEVPAHDRGTDKLRLVERPRLAAAPKDGGDDLDQRRNLA